MLQKLVIRKTFTCDCMIASVLGIAVIYITETDIFEQGNEISITLFDIYK